MSNKKIIDELNALDHELTAFVSRWNFKAARLRNMLGAGGSAPSTRKGSKAIKSLVAEAGAKRRMNILTPKQ